VIIFQVPDIFFSCPLGMGLTPSRNEECSVQYLAVSKNSGSSPNNCKFANFIVFSSFSYILKHLVWNETSPMREFKGGVVGFLVYNLGSTKAPRPQQLDLLDGRMDGKVFGHTIAGYGAPPPMSNQARGCVQSFGCVFTRPPSHM